MRLEETILRAFECGIPNASARFRKSPPSSAIFNNLPLSVEDTVTFFRAGILDCVCDAISKAESAIISILISFSFDPMHRYLIFDCRIVKIASRNELIE